MQREEIKGKLLELDCQQKELERQKDFVEPRLRHKLSLYAHVSKIVWDLQALDRVAGTIDDPEYGNLGEFDLGSAKDATTFEDVNTLWDMIQASN